MRASGPQIPGNERMGGALLYPKEKQANGNDAVIPAATYVIDYDYIPTLGMKIASGRNFSRDFPTDSAGDFVGAAGPSSKLRSSLLLGRNLRSTRLPSSSPVTFASSVILNESAVRELGWSRVDPIGRMVVGSNNDHLDFSDLLNMGLKNLFRLDSIYGTGDTEKRREVISSMYPEKLTFDGDRLRTTRINEAARIIYTLDKAFSEKEKGQSGNISALSSQVDHNRFSSYQIAYR